MLRIILCPSATWANGMKTTSLASSGGKKRKRKSTSAAARSQKSGATGLPLKIKLHSLLYFWEERNTERARRGVESRNSWSSDQIKCFVCRRSVLDTHKTLKFRKKTRPMVMGRCDRAPNIGPRKSPVDHCCDAGQLCVCGGKQTLPGHAVIALRSLFCVLDKRQHL